MVVTRVVMRFGFIENKLTKAITCRLVIHLPGKMLISTFESERRKIKKDLTEIIKQKLGDYGYQLTDDDVASYDVLNNLMKNKECVIEYPSF